MNYDLVIRNGLVVDGTGAAPTPADVAIAGGRIAAVGKVDGRGSEEVDAQGHVVTPGFIDIHTHMDAQMFWDTMGSSSCWHGVTTAVIGNCGFTLAPARSSAHELVVRNLERAEDISAKAMAEGVRWSWERFADYLDAIERLPKGINYASYVGHSALRTWAMGERAFESAASDDDLRLMEGELRNALEAGAIGFSTSCNQAHLTSDDRPIASRYAEWDEFRHLAGVVGGYRSRMFEISLDHDTHHHGTPEQRLIFDRLKELARVLPVTFGVVPTKWADDLMGLVDESVRDGGQMIAQTHSRGITLVTSFLTRLPFDVLAEWAEVRSQPLERQRALLQDPQVRAKLIHAAHHGSYSAAIGAEAPRPDYDTYCLFDNPIGANESVAAAARRENLDPVELIIDRALATDFKQFFVQPVPGGETTFVSGDASHLERLMRHPRSVMSFSDAGAHVSQIIDCSIQTNLLAYWVRERQAFSLEEAIHMLTQVPAATWGFSDRGVLREGLVADLNVFDPDTVGPAMPTVEADLPGGGQRLVQGSTGFLATIVGGEVTQAEGKPTGATPGKLLRRAN